jgi:hypothetical protein
MERKSLNLTLKANNILTQRILLNQGFLMKLRKKVGIIIDSLKG